MPAWVEGAEPSEQPQPERYGYRRHGGTEALPYFLGFHNASDEPPENDHVNNDKAPDARGGVAAMCAVNRVHPSRASRMHDVVRLRMLTGLTSLTEERWEGPLRQVRDSTERVEG